MNETIIYYAVGIAARAVLLFIGLWIMIKLQKLNYSFLGLLGSTVVVSGLDMIPVAGHYIAVVVLFGCIAKMTLADLFPDVAFTVVVAYALVFCMNLFVLGALMGDLRPSARAKEMTAMESKGGTNLVTSGVTNESITNDPVVVTNVPKRVELTNSPIVAVAAKTPEAPAPTPKAPATAAAPATPVPAAKSGREIAKDFTIKGILQSSDKPMVMINTGIKTHTVLLGETISMQTKDGQVPVRCDELSGNRVVLDVAGESVTLFSR